MKQTDLSSIVIWTMCVRAVVIYGLVLYYELTMRAVSIEFSMDDVAVMSREPYYEL